MTPKQGRYTSFHIILAQTFQICRDNTLRLVLDGAICLDDSFEFAIYHCMRLKAFRHELVGLNRIAADKSHSVIVAKHELSSSQSLTIQRAIGLILLHVFPSGCV